MALRKCPRCELNYIKEDEQFCNVCRRGMNMKAVKEEPEQNTCIDCGENVALKGKELCAYCFGEQRRREKLAKLMDKPAQMIINMDDMDDMDDMDRLDEVDEVEIPTDIPSEELEDINEEFGDDEEENEEEADFEEDEAFDTDSDYNASSPYDEFDDDEEETI